MSRRPHAESYDTRRRLLQSAEQEFALQGYDKASLRQICTSAGVTTGALYFFFDNKEDLFKNVLISVTKNAIQILENYTQQLLVSNKRNLEDTPLGNKETLDKFLDLLYSHRHVVQILVNNQENQYVARFFEELTEAISLIIKAILYPNVAQVTPHDDFIIAWLAQIEIVTPVTILKNDETREEADSHINSAVMFMQGGIEALSTKH